MSEIRNTIEEIIFKNSAEKIDVDQIKRAIEKIVKNNQKHRLS